jgi:glycosyltransferase involved in cell wall biosynthesis
VNVLLVVPWDHESGGVVSVAGNLARYLTARGHGVLFLHPSDDDRLVTTVTKWSFRGVRLNTRSPLHPMPDESDARCERPLRSVAAFSAHLLPTLVQLGGLVRREAIDIVNIHYPSEYYVYFGVLRWLGWFKLVLSVHGAEMFPHGLPQPKYSPTFRLLMRAADAVVTPSRSMLDDVLRVFPEVRDKSRAVHNATDVAAIRGGAGPSGPPYLLCVALHNRRKGLDVLLQAFMPLARTHPALQLWLAGDGPLRRELEALATRLDLTNRVRFLGMQSPAQVKALMDGALAVVLPSRAEPFGLAIVEAMATGKAVVASAVGGIPEIIADGETGLLVPPGDAEALTTALRSLVEDAALRGRLARAGYDHVRRSFTWDVAGAKYEALYRSLLGEAAGAPDAVSAISSDRLSGALAGERTDGRTDVPG